MLHSEKIPSALTSVGQWLLWNTDKKLPFRTDGTMASVTDPHTWTSFTAAAAKFDRGGYRGVGFVFTADDPFCGVDLDGCRNAETGKVEQWAREIILSLDSYAEVSPSGTGVKVFIRGKLPWDSGRRLAVPGAEKIADKEPHVELYDQKRYFAVTGQRLGGIAFDVMDRQPQLDALIAKYAPKEPEYKPTVDYHSEAAVLDRARKYVATMPPAVEGQGGHNALFKVACVTVLGFGLQEQDAMTLLREYSATCNPPWSEKELVHKYRQASKQGGTRNYLRNIAPERWGAVNVPKYEAPQERPAARTTDLVAASRAYIAKVKAGNANLLDLGLGDLDTHIGGGIEPGEIIVIAARPGHGKSAAALQIVHQWTAEGRPCLFVSEEMSAMVLGKRTLQYVSEEPREHWRTSIAQLERDIDEYAKERAACLIAESCGTAVEAVEQMERAVESHKIQLAIVDYAQLLSSPGKSSYESTTNTCKYLTAAAKRLGITLIMLCQMSREIEKRKQFAPIMSDLKESGQFEQDADVIMFLVWPHKIDSRQPANEYKIYVAKNRNRETTQHVVLCKFLPSRQTITVESHLERAKKKPNYSEALAAFNNMQSEEDAVDEFMRS